MEDCITCVGKQIDQNDNRVIWIYFQVKKDNQKVLFQMPLNIEDSEKFEIGSKWKIRFTEIQEID